ncbi:RABIF [Lepeophtheirus salmonis]|uniref:RABIF n=1 Tax=Lepeophtheirus salmonis TaxID=72036 RepID=A0A7R8CB27_LEPSM|nr:RABIF [Lepeophtheirus salmonis]CAF2756799.1 RABIF [Lepeophtheirus salmonis]
MNEDTIDLTVLKNENGKNVKQVICKNCSSKIIAPNVGTYEEIDFELHPLRLKKNSSPSDVEKEKIKQYYRVEDMFDFDNVGFSHTVDDTKFLACADCEMGPIGWHSLSTKKSVTDEGKILKNYFFTGSVGHKTGS